MTPKPKKKKKKQQQLYIKQKKIFVLDPYKIYTYLAAA